MKLSAPLASWWAIHRLTWCTVLIGSGALAGCSLALSERSDASDKPPDNDCPELDPVFVSAESFQGNAPLMFPPGVVRIDTDSGVVSDQDEELTVESILVDGVRVVAASDIIIPGGTVVRATGTRPLMLVARGTFEVHGVIDVSSSEEFGTGAGASSECVAAFGVAGAGGGGAGFGGEGGEGGSTDVNTGGEAGAPVMLRGRPEGGCRGGPGAGGANGGFGGGSVTLVARCELRVTGGVHAGGAGGLGGGLFAATSGGGGGGSGGNINLFAPVIALDTATLTANGGGGGGGGTTANNGAPGDPGGTGTNAAVGGPGGTTSDGIGGSGGSLDNDCREFACDGELGVVAGGGGGGGVGIIVYESADLTTTGGVVISPPLDPFTR